MDLKQKKLANSIGSAIGITLFILVLAGVTYAFYRWTSSNINISGESTCFAVDYTKGPNIETESVILFDESTIINNNQITIKNGMALTGLTAGNSTCETTVELTVNLTINSLNNAFITGNSIGAFKYVVASYDPTSYQTISTTSLIGETFDIIKSGSITSTNKIKLLTDVLTSTQKGYLVIFYVDGDLANNDASNSSFSATISAEASQYIKPTLATHITNLYLDNKDAQPVENNGILYRYARIYDNDDDETTSGGLMNDRLGSTSVGEDDGNIRYYGENPNNFIDIGDTYKETTVINNMEKNDKLIEVAGRISGASITDEESCRTYFNCDLNYNQISSDFYEEFEDAETCKKMFDIENIDKICGTETKEEGEPVLYRIIGVFKDVKLADGTSRNLIKVIREDSIGEFSFDVTSEYDFDNNWHNASLNNLLNNGYLKSSPNVILYNINTLTSKVADFSTIGISSIQDKIATVEWNLGAYTYNDVYSNVLYEAERSEVLCPNCEYKTWTGKIALSYPSDHGYGADLSQCPSFLQQYIWCNSVNWMSTMSNGAYKEWLLTPGELNESHEWFVQNGIISSNMVYSNFGVRPTFYLIPELVMESGTGTKTNPYVVK